MIMLGWTRMLGFDDEVASIERKEQGSRPTDARKTQGERPCAGNMEGESMELSAEAAIIVENRL